MSAGDVGIGARLAVGTLTIVPVGRLPAVDRAAARWAMVLAPLAAVPLGVLVGGVVALGAVVHLPAAALGAVACLALGWATRAMHWDGLADTADGLAAGWDRERALAVMRRGDAGPVAIAVLGLVLLADAVCLGALAAHPFGWLVAGASVVAARAACAVTSARGVPAARPDGLGVVVAGCVPPSLAAVVALAGTAIVAAAGHLAGLSVVSSLAALPLGLLAVVVLVRKCVRMLGGVTGDVMGAGIEVALAATLLVLSTGSWPA